MADVVINGSDIFVFIDGVKVAHAKSHTLSMTMATRNTSNKDTGKFNTKAPGRLDITASSEALVVYNDLAVILAAYLDRQPVHLHFAENASGSPDETKFYAEGDFIISNMEINAADEENASYSVSFDHYDGFTWSGEVALRVGVIGTPCSANEVSDGFAAAFPKGGTAPYTFSWDTDPAKTTQYAAALPAGTYTVTVTDSATPTPAEAEATVTITEPAA
jgi:hypothetical protein